jgi:hypothetical protein
MEGIIPEYDRKGKVRKENLTHFSLSMISLRYVAPLDHQ